MQTSPASFGGVHTALVNLAASILAERNWTQLITPSTDAERDDAAIEIPSARGTTTRFSQQLIDLADSVSYALLSYMLTRRKGPSALAVRR